MEVVFPYCAGLDVHKKRVTACRLVSDSTGQVPEGVAELPAIPAEPASPVFTGSAALAFRKP